MTELRITPRGTGFAALAALAASITLTTPSHAEGSELPDGSVVIKALPFTDTGDTSDNDDNFDAVCPYAGSVAPDVFYSITPLTDVEVDITLCNSDYDTKLYVLDEFFGVIACNDDACEDAKGDPTLRSLLECVPLQAGKEYHIAVDGFTEMGVPQSGPYEITVAACIPPPPFLCPMASMPEGEACVFDSDDEFNGGCNTEPTRFSPIACGDVICGSSWVKDGGRRDTDWYEVVTDEPMRFTLRGEFAYATGTLGVIFFEPGFEGSGDCTKVLGTNPFVNGGPGEIVSVTTDLLPAGTHWFFIAPNFGNEVTCDVPNEYWFELTCAPELPSCPWDTDGDGQVATRDLVDLLSNWGPCPE